MFYFQTPEETIRMRKAFLRMWQSPFCSPYKTISSVSVKPQPLENAPVQAKPLTEMPGHGIWTMIYWLMRGYLNKTHELQLINKKKYGTLWLSEVRGHKAVNVADPHLIEQVLRNEGRFPSRGDIKEWKEHRRLQGLEFGPILKEGEDWHRLRTILNQRILKPQEAKLYEKTINSVVTDLIKRIQFLKETKGSGIMVYDLANEMYRFSFEGISSVVLDCRLGCLEANIPKETQEFISAVNTMLQMSAIVPVLPEWTRPFLPFWKKHNQAWDTMFNFAKRKVDQRLAGLQTQLERGDPVEGDYLTYLLKSQELTQSEIYSSVTDLLLAGVDTTSNTLTWALYHLARDQELQNSVYREVSGVIPGDHIPNAVDLEKMPLVKAVIKEVLRLYPVVPANGRILQTDLVLGEYYIPSKVFMVLCHYAASVEESQFPDPLAFKPERWIKKEQGKKPHPFSSVPFGYGVRGCLGRRIAELEMYLALSRLVKNFEIQTNPKSKPVNPKTRILIVPGAPVNLEFHNRSSVV
ncbi:sterol 26-hydroxylase, mitochondrial-like isoform X2 [Lepisosteus oculatus]|uniref:sterol 26-hydroxylase, mitochondrial-like isoform X2 n=1 Tax=Lepisosteus oculatus TaxID=7918 RepID=UPI0035F515B0